eukprot:tig00000430_g647.t1
MDDVLSLANAAAPYKARAHLDAVRAARFFGAPAFLQPLLESLARRGTLAGGVAIEALVLAEQEACQPLRALALRRAVETRRQTVRSGQYRALPASHPELARELARALEDFEFQGPASRGGPKI